MLEPFPVESAPLPFDGLGLDPRLLEGIRDLGFTDTRPIQSAVITLSLAGNDLIACAETGSGKTCAFVIPMLQRILSTTATTKSRVLVLAPTRELAVQIEDEIHGVTYHTPITSVAVFGGVEMGPQERALKAGVDIIVATPGRLIDHMRQQNADFSGVELLVLDEADRMMDMGFWPDVRRIIAALPASRQTLLFSATMPDDVVRSAFEIVKEPKFIQVGQRSMPAKSITHSKHEVSAGHKAEWLIEHLKKPEGPVLIFSRTKIGADKLAQKAAVGRHPLHRAACGSHDGSAAPGGRGIQRRQVPRARRDRHRRARSRHRRHPHRHQLRSPGFTRHVRPPRRAHGPRQQSGPRDHARLSRRASRARAAGKIRRRSNTIKTFSFNV